MSSPPLSRIVAKSLKVILGEDFKILIYERLPSRRNEVFKITGSRASQPNLIEYVAKFYHQPGIVHESTILTQARQRHIAVPKVIGSTSDVLVLEYIDAPNLCDLITLKPDFLFGKLLASWLANYHTAFQRSKDQVLVKGDARIRNFLVQPNHLVGVDFEECHIGSYLEDLAVTCASILDTVPLFTKNKLQLCQRVIRDYATIRHLPNGDRLRFAVTSLMISMLWDTAQRRGNPPQLVKNIREFEKGALSF